MKNILLFCTILLTGCSTTVPVKQYFPTVPANLLKQCPQLQTINKDSVQLSELMSVVTKNYTEYHSCANIVEAWQEWYKKQKQIYEELNN